MKKTISILLLFIVLVTGFAFESKASSNISIRLNSVLIEFSEAPIVSDNRIMIPLRDFAMLMGVMDISWEGETQRVTLLKEDLEIIFFVGENIFFVNDEEFEMDVPVAILKGRVMVPVRALSEVFDYQVDWDAKHRTVLLEKEDIDIPEDFIAFRQYTLDEVLWLARIVHAESRGQVYEGQIAVANVVLNRVDSPRFPDSIEGVIFDVKWGTQFPPAHKESFRTMIPNEKSYQAALDALKGVMVMEGALFFNNRPMSKRANNFIQKLGGNYFYR